MEIHVRDDDHIVEIWLTGREKSDEQFKKTLKPIYNEYKQKKYKVAVFESGNGDLQDYTAGLLLHNRML